MGQSAFLNIVCRWAMVWVAAQPVPVSFGRGQCLVSTVRILVILLAKRFHSRYAADSSRGMFARLKHGNLSGRAAMPLRKRQRLFAETEKVLSTVAARKQNVWPQPLLRLFLLLQKTLCPCMTFLFSEHSPYPYNKLCRIRAPINPQCGQGLCFRLRRKCWSSFSVR